MNTFAIVEMMSIARGLRPSDVRGPRRYAELVRARRDIAKALRNDGCSYPEIGRALGGRHHTAAMYLAGAIRRPAKKALVVESETKGAQAG